MKYPLAIREVIKYLKENFENLKTMNSGVYEIDNNASVHLMDINTEDRKNKFPEVHRKYIDVQLLIKGREKITFFIDTNTEIIRENALDERDIMFYENNENITENTIEMSEGTFLVLFPEDVHIPGIISGSDSNVRKVVVKVPCDNITTSSD